MLDYLDKFGKMKNGVGVEIFVNTMDQILSLIINSTQYQQVLSLLIPIGVILCVIYFCVDIMDRVANVNFNIETLVRRFARFLFVYVVIVNIPSLLTGVNDFISALNEEIMSGLTATDGLAAYIESNNDLITTSNAIRENSTGGLIAFINSGIALMFNVILQFTTISLGVQRAVTIGVKGALAPLIIPDMFNNGMNSSGMKFLKGLFADYAETTAVIFLVEMSCIVAFGGDTTVTGHSSIAFLAVETLVSGIIVSIVLIGSVQKAGQYISSAMEGYVN